MYQSQLSKRRAVMMVGAAAYVAAVPLSAAAAQESFPTPEAAVAALTAAFKNVDEQVLLGIFGDEHQALIVVSDQVAQREALTELYIAALEGWKLEKDGVDKRILILGRKDWPFPIPLVKEAQGWRFDTAAGADEILNRRIGENELETIETCRAFVSAQVEYASRDRDGDQVLEYAQKVGSTAGKQDGLYWEVKSSTEEASPFGPFLADASAYVDAAREASKAKEKSAFHGYYYKILTRQGQHPPGGKYDYVINGNMIAGFGLLAWPADYGSSGIKSFLVSHQGMVHEKDLGNGTADVAKGMQAYDPDDTWVVVESD